MQTKPLSVILTDDSLPAVFWSLIEFETLALGLLETAEVPSTEIDFVRRRTAKAVIKLGNACTGERRTPNLRMADAAVASCLDLFRLFRARQWIDARAYDETYRRVQQIRAGLSVLASTPPDAWSSAPLPPIETPSQGSSATTNGSWYEQLRARVDQALASLTFPTKVVCDDTLADATRTESALAPPPLAEAA